MKINRGRSWRAALGAVVLVVAGSAFAFVTQPWAHADAMNSVQFSIGAAYEKPITVNGRTLNIQFRLCAGDGSTTAVLLHRCANGYGWRLLEDGRIVGDHPEVRTCLEVKPPASVARNLACDASNPYQEWDLAYLGSAGIFQLRNRADGKCLTSALAGGTYIAVGRRCAETADMAWIMAPQPRTTVQVRSLYSDKCWTMADASTTVNLPVIQWSCSTANSRQRFLVELARMPIGVNPGSWDEVSPAMYALRANQSKRCLGSQGDVRNGAPLVQKACPGSGGDPAYWSMSSRAGYDSFHFFLNWARPYAIDLKLTGGGDRDGQPIQHYAANPGKRNQRWILST